MKQIADLVGKKLKAAKINYMRKGDKLMVYPADSQKLEEFTKEAYQELKDSGKISVTDVINNVWENEEI